jgi:large subunit ribosomal protein L4
MQVKSYKAGTFGQVEVDERALHDKAGKARVLYRTLKDAVVMHQANQRQGNAYTRGRDEVVGSNKKPWKQKHTGRARAGDRKSPIWRGGGTLFGPKTRDWSYHMPAKAKRVATRTALLGKLQDGEVVVAELGAFPRPSAKSARKILSDMGRPRRALVVIEGHDEALWKSFRNFPGVRVRTADEVCAHDLVAGGLVIAQSAALEKLTRRVGKTGGAA